MSRQTRRTLLAFTTALLLALPAFANPPDSAVELKDGELVACITTKGQFKEPSNLAGMKELAELAHRHGFPVTWIIKPFTAREAAQELNQWHQDFGDEVAWFSEGASLKGAEDELRALREVVT